MEVDVVKLVVDEIAIDIQQRIYAEMNVATDPRVYKQSILTKLIQQN